MAISGDRPSQRCIEAWDQAGHGLVASKLPLDDMVSFSMEGKKFTANFKGDCVGTATYGDEDHAWIPAVLAGTVFKLNKVMTGTIDVEKKKVTLDPGCFVASKKVVFVNFNYSLLEMQVTSEDETNMKGGWGYIEHSEAVDISTIILTKLTWTSASGQGGESK